MDTLGGQQERQTYSCQILFKNGVDWRWHKLTLRYTLRQLLKTKKETGLISRSLFFVKFERPIQTTHLPVHTPHS